MVTFRNPLVFGQGNNSITTTYNFTTKDLRFIEDFYVDIVASRLINSTLDSLSYIDLFKELYTFQLVDLLKKLFLEGTLLCYVYIDAEGIARAIHEDKKEYKTLKEIKIEITQSNVLASQIKITAESLANLLTANYVNIGLSKSVVFKMDGARGRIGSGEQTSVAEYVAKSLRNSNVLTIDSKDSIENGMVNLNVDSQRAQMMLLFSGLSATTGFPLSYFSGDFGGGIASTDNIEKSRLFEAKKVFFKQYLYSFFRYISLIIEPKQKLGDVYTLTEIQNFMISFEDKIDVEETIKNLGFTLKK